MPKVADGLQRVIDLAQQIERAEHAILQAQWELESLTKELEEATLAYAAQRAKSAETEETREPPPPWTDDSLTAPDRIRAYFQARPHTKVTASELVAAGINITIENMRSTLKRMTDAGELSRVAKGKYALAKPENGEASA
jgi:hypothetical protein